jgi:hypothetical protein
VAGLLASLAGIECFCRHHRVGGAASSRVNTPGISCRDPTAQPSRSNGDCRSDLYRAATGGHMPWTFAQRVPVGKIERAPPAMYTYAPWITSKSSAQLLASASGEQGNQRISIRETCLRHVAPGPCELVVCVASETSLPIAYRASESSRSYGNHACFFGAYLRVDLARGLKLAQREGVDVAVD